MMAATLVGIIGNCFTGICLSAASLLLFRLFLPNSTGNRSSLFRRMLRASYYFYASILYWLRPRVAQVIDLDLLSPVPRTLCTTGFSIGLGWGMLALVGLHMPTWLLILISLHGVVVGWSWERLVRADDFQFGTRLE